jgi:bacterial/archaeal transporter family-2 protein
VSLLVYLAAIAAGIANPVQTGASAQLRKSVNNPIFAAAYVYFGGLFTVLLIQLIVRQGWPGTNKFTSVPWWAWSAGLLSVAATMSGIMLAQKLGSGVFTGVSVTAAIVTSIALDHFGWIGFKQHPASWPRMLGGGLMIVGLWLMSRF